MIIVAVNSISKMYGGSSVFKDLSFEMKEGERVGLVGPNGSGKTTVLKLIAGVESIDSGAIHLKKGTKIGYLAQIPVYPEGTLTKDVLEGAFDEIRDIERKMKVLEKEMTSVDGQKLERLLEEYGKLQDTFMHLGGYEAEAELLAVANGLSIHSLLNRPFNQLSGGEKTKVNLGLILLQKPNLLLLDEPTNHLDIAAIEWLEQYVKQANMSFIFISHDRYFLDEVATAIYELEDGEISTYKGNYSSFMKEKEQRLLEEFANYQEQQKKIKKMQDAIRRLRQWAHEGDNEKFFKKAASMQKALDRMDKIKKPIFERKKMDLQFEMNERSGKDVFVYEDVEKSFGEKVLFQPTSFTIHYKDRAALVGNNGTGKSTLLKFLTDEMKLDRGMVRVGSNVKLGYLSQSVMHSEKNETVIESFRDVVPVAEGEARQLLARFMFYGNSVFKRVNGLSGGERMRLRLAQMMYQDINVLLLDEPTNHLDIDSREVLEEALSEFDGTIFAVSHDRYFINKLFSKILWLDEGKVTPYVGNYDEAKAKKTELQKLPVKVAPIVEKKEWKKPKVDYRKKMEQLEIEIIALEDQLIEIDEEMSCEQNVEKLLELQQERDTVVKHRDLLFSELEKLDELSS
ncbi:ABC-F type ribosomal protection protein [Bacillus timonensis]|nr:ABC-F type ribosomal protection protein [Bacillus timonensis]